MKIGKTILAASVVALGVLSYPVVSQAFTGDHAYRSERHCGQSADGGQARHGWWRLAERLNLTKEQRQAMNAIEDKYRPELRDLRQLLKDNHAALAKMEPADAKLQELADAQGKTIADLIVVRKQMRSEVAKVLTEEQRHQVREMLQRQHHHHGFDRE